MRGDLAENWGGKKEKRYYRSGGLVGKDESVKGWRGTAQQKIVIDAADIQYKSPPSSTTVPLAASEVSLSHFIIPCLTRDPQLLRDNNNKPATKSL
ncbi:hypothetical protein Pcinc_027259 [Petrolisthes cinctipes]|uniref:Uncharacterized protein n=1 Tax=Petrolisthes cinctipes TaxID=88211 RepID=A0AAE1F4E8_PETCI|nr:hypothetical protein Pcinc_027259 [Petrolisthes cinctipes]